MVEWGNNAEMTWMKRMVRMWEYEEVELGVDEVEGDD